MTLVELLVVLALLGVLASLILPVATRVPALIRSLRCKNNLKHISEAYNAFKATERMDMTDSTIAADVWQAVLMPYLGRDEQVLFCPEDVTPFFHLPESSITIYDGSTKLYEVQLFDAHPYWLEGDHNEIAAELDGHKPGMWRVSETVFNNGSVDRYNLPKYIPDGSPVSWWVIEDQRYGDQNQYAQGDQDFYDIDIQMEDLGGGVYEVITFHRAAGFNFGIRDSDGVEHREVGGRIGPLEMEGKGGSYGMNWRVGLFRPGFPKILAMDYGESVVYAGGNLDDEVQNWDLLEVRHFGEINMALTDGSVRTARPEEIDPADPEYEVEWWSP